MTRQKNPASRKRRARAGPAPCLCRPQCTFRPRGARRPRGVCVPVLKTARVYKMLKYREDGRRSQSVGFIVAPPRRLCLNGLEEGFDSGIVLAAAVSAYPRLRAVLAQGLPVVVRTVLGASNRPWQHSRSERVDAIGLSPRNGRLSTSVLPADKAGVGKERNNRATPPNILLYFLRPKQAPLDHGQDHTGGTAPFLLNALRPGASDGASDTVYQIRCIRLCSTTFGLRPDRGIDRAMPGPASCKTRRPA